MLLLPFALAFALAPHGPLPEKVWDAHLEEWMKLTDEATELMAKGKANEAQRVLERALPMARRLARADDNAMGQQALLFTLKPLAVLQWQRDQLAEADEKCREALRISRKLAGGKDNKDIANDLGILANILSSQGRYRDALQLQLEAHRMRERLYAGRDHEYMVLSLSDLGYGYEAVGKLVEAEACCRQAAEMATRLFPKRDHPFAGAGLSPLAQVLGKRGKWAEAEQAARDAVAIDRKVYGNNQPAVAGALTLLAATLRNQGKGAEAEPLLTEALDIYAKAYPGEDNTHRATALDDLGQCLIARGKYDDAEPLLREALGINRRLFGKDPNPAVASALSQLGLVDRCRGKLAESEAAYRDALAMARKVFEPGDHPDLALYLKNLGFARHELGESAGAQQLLLDAWRMSRRLTTAAAGQMAEGDALTLAAAERHYRDAYLSNAFEGNAKAGDVYAEMFAARGSVSRIYEQRQLQARAAASDPVVAKQLVELADARARRAELLLARPTKDEATRAGREATLSALEKLVAEKGAGLRKAFTPAARVEKLGAATPADLQQALPATAVVVDFVGWTKVEFDPKKPGRAGERHTDRYAAFVVTRTDIKWLDLGPAVGIETAVARWREAINDRRQPVPVSLGMKVRELVWEPVRKEFPKGTTEVYISPDYGLCRVPWVALPGDKAGTVLLEDDFAVATIPHAPFLLDQLWGQVRPARPQTGLLVVGGVDFDAEPAVKADPKTPPLGSSLFPKAPSWAKLDGTKSEADGLLALAREKKMPVESLVGEQATPAAVLAALPKARYAHLATHGFFADKQFRSAFQLEEKDYLVSVNGERIGRAANSPLVMTGLVLAGANHPMTPGRGVVTGESLVDLDLSGLELSVLSACETGLGDVAGGEGAFGLQRAFHTAGTRNVIASLWKVDDAATAALMGEFYRHLWEKALPPIQALKTAQLAVYRANAKQFSALVQRGFEVGDKELKNLPLASGANGGDHPALWAAFTMSGIGR